MERTYGGGVYIQLMISLTVVYHVLKREKQLQYKDAFSGRLQEER